MRFGVSTLLFPTSDHAITWAGGEGQGGVGGGPGAMGGGRGRGSGGPGAGHCTKKFFIYHVNFSPFSSYFTCCRPPL